MKTTPEKLRFLTDVLKDESYHVARREAVMAAMAGARRRRRWKRAPLAMAACLALAAVIQWTATRPLPSGNSNASVLTVVRTQPLLPHEIVRTGQAQQPDGVLVIFSTGIGPIETVRTGQSTEELSDQELLDLFKGRPVALVTVNDGQRQLIVLDDKTAGR